MDILIHSDGSYEIYHHGVKGMKWGVRRYQNPDGSLKKGHKNRYGEPPSGVRKQRAKKKVETGKKFMDKVDMKQAVKVLKTTAAVASGALWLASALTTGNVAAAANTVAAVGNLVAMVPHDMPDGND